MVPESNANPNSDAEETFGEGAGTGRLEAFSDGVMAIAITLLILNVHVPTLQDGSGPGKPMTASGTSGRPTTRS